MQHLILHFTHSIEDIVPWCNVIEELKPQLARSGVGQFDSDDMESMAATVRLYFEAWMQNSYWPSSFRISKTWIFYKSQQLKWSLSSESLAVLLSGKFSA